MKCFLFYLAVTGWILGLIVNLLSIAGIDVTEYVPFVWVLHVGAIVVWIPVVLDLQKNNELKAFQQRGLLKIRDQREFFKIIFKNTPRWLAIIAIVGFFYAFVNFILFMFLQTGASATHNHGELVKTVTEQEYHRNKANEVRGFSGHWIAFYGVAMALLFPFKRNIPGKAIE